MLFGTVRQKIFYRKTWYSLLTQKNCRHPKFYETQKGSSTKWFSTERQNNFDGKSWQRPPPLLSINFSASGNFLKQSTEGFPYEVFRNCGTKILNRKTCYSLIPLPTPLPLSMKIFDTRKIVKHRRVPIGDFPVLRDKKKFERQTSHNLVNQKRFRYPKLVKL